MLKTLLKTWGALAPDELEVRGGGEYVFAKTYFDCIYYPEIVSIYDSFFEEPYSKDMLQGYIQRCILARGWSWECSKRLMYSATIFLIEEEDTVKYRSELSLAETLLTAYLAALAAQRPIEKGGLGSINAVPVTFDPTPQHCPHCFSSAKRNGLTAAGTQRYRCSACKKTFTTDGKAAGWAVPNDRLTPQQRWNRTNRDKKDQ